jgi:hypothetical protein
LFDSLDPLFSRTTSGAPILSKSALSGFALFAFPFDPAVDPFAAPFSPYNGKFRSLKEES